MRAATGQPRAVEACIDRFGPLVWSLARTLLSNPAQVEDAVQEAFIEIWRASPRFDPAIASAKSFVAMIARRRIIDRGRAEQSRTRAVRPLDSFIEATAVSPSRQPLLDTDAARLAQVVAQLDPEQQRTIRLSVGQGWSHQEISDRLGIPLGTVKTNLRRGLLRLRELIDGVPDRAASVQEVPR